MGKPGCIEADAEGGLIDGAALPINNEEQRTLRQHGEVRPEMQVRGYEELYVVVNVLLSLAPLPSPQSDLRSRYFTPSQHVTAAFAHVVPRHTDASKPAHSTPSMPPMPWAGQHNSCALRG